MSSVISTTLDIDATPQAVWDVLTDFAAYGEWNPFMDRAEGTPAVGAKLLVHLAPNGGSRHDHQDRPAADDAVDQFGLNVGNLGEQPPEVRSHGFSTVH